MKLFPRKAPWYSAGLAFECQSCGGCCAGPEEGYVWITRQEIEDIAIHLRISVAEMISKYVRKVGRRFSLREVPETKDCVFLDTDQHGRRLCSVYALRPTQCRTWPFWDSNLRGQGEWSLAGVRCRGINRGELHRIEDIQARRNVTRE